MALKSRNDTLGLQISHSLLHRLSQRFTELMLHCLPQANKVTFYLVGSVPHLRITRLGMAARNQETNEIQWSASSKMDSDLSGKYWKDVRDCSTDALGALNSCLQNQRTWTSSGSKDDFSKEVKKSCGELLQKHFHFQPVLVRKDDLWQNMPPPSVYPRDRDGKPIWLDSDYVTVALIEINYALEFYPFDPNCWQVTEELTRALAIQLLYLHSKEFYSKKIEVITEEKDELGTILITQIRKMMVKLNLINRVVDNQMADLRQSWENLIHEHHPEQPCRSNIVKQLNLLLEKLTVDNTVVSESKTVKQLTWYQNKLAEFCFLPEENQVWFQQKIVPLWQNAALRFNSAPDVKSQIKKLLDQLEQSFYVGSNEKLIRKIDNIPSSVKSKWVNLAYNEKHLPKADLLKEYTYLLEEISIYFPNKRKTLENLICLRNLAIYLQSLEDNLSEYIDRYKTNIQVEQIQLH